jgi:hypothetical protein
VTTSLRQFGGVTIGDLRDARDALAGMSPAGLRRVAVAFERMLNGIDPAEALGLAALPNGRQPLDIDREQRRDAELRAWRAAYHAGLSDRAAGQEIAQCWRRYAAAALRGDRAAPEMPAHYRGTWRQHAFTIAKIGGEVPGADRLRKILAVNLLGCAGRLAMPQIRTDAVGKTVRRDEAA